MRRNLFRQNLRRSLLIFVVGCSISCEEATQEVEVWHLNSTESIGGYTPEIFGEPVVITECSGETVEFDGKNDGLLIDANPIHGMKNFTIEMEIKPYKAYPENVEQRFLHIQDPLNENRRILLELRLNAANEWYGDWFLKSEDESIALLDSTKTHPVGEWTRISLVYNEGAVKGYVNGTEEVSGRIDFLPVGKGGKTSIGTRMDKRSWFRGAIKEVRFLTTGSDFE